MGIVTPLKLLSLLEAVKDDPDEDDPRLILADWIEEHGGKPEEALAAAPSGARQGLHGQRLTDTSRPGSEKPRRFVLPPGALA